MFNTEKEFVEYLVININNWVKDFFNEEVENYYINKNLSLRFFGPNKPSIDIVIKTKTGKKIGVECKNPKQLFHETSRAISQLLAYDILAEESGEPFDILAFVSSSKHNIGFKIIKKYKLPIRIFYIDKEIHGEMK